MAILKDPDMNFNSMITHARATRNVVVAVHNSPFFQCFQNSGCCAIEIGNRSKKKGLIFPPAKESAITNIMGRSRKGLTYSIVPKVHNISREHLIHYIVRPLLTLLCLVAICAMNNECS